MSVNNELYIGTVAEPLMYFNSATLKSVTGCRKVDLVGSELSVDVLEPVVEYTWTVGQYLKPTDKDALQSSDGYMLCGYYNLKPSDIPYATPVWYYTGGELTDKYYFKYAERSGRDEWIIHAVSIVGLLDVEMHRGGVYTGKTFAEVLTEFFGGTVGTSTNGITPITGGMVNCLVEDAVAATTVHGLLPYATKRENLHQLIFCYCVNLTKAEDGDLIFSYLKPQTNPPQIPVERIYSGGTMDYEQPVTDVELTEYTYIYDESVEPESIYDNTTAVQIKGEALVLFDTPIRPETIYTSEPTMIVRDANEVSAYVTGNGIIYAVKYQTQERIISRSAEGVVLRRTVSVNGLTLINPLNSSNLMSRLYDYYTQRQVVNMAIVVESEKPGERYSFKNPYGEDSTGFIASMEFATVGITKADCEIIANYEPTGMSTNMQNVILLTGSGVWPVPPAVRERDNPFIRTVLIAGGQGGHGGYSGKSSDRNPDKPGAGGEGGEGGSGGKVLTVDINVKDIASIAYACGLGGEGGASDTEGAMGTDTTFGDDSTLYGAVAPGGIMNLIDGKFYARAGANGRAGAAGGKGAPMAGNVPSSEEIAGYGFPGEGLTYKNTEWKGGEGGGGTAASQQGYYGWALGAGGGGAAMGANGSRGGDGRVQWQSVIGGQGGAGATATIVGDDAQYIGNGGNGGHGGGGGGAPGKSGFSAGSSPTGYVGPGGKGSKGGEGAPGGILIYY